MAYEITYSFFLRKDVMSIGLIVVLIIAFSLVVGPMMMMRPNPAQKLKEHMRSLARAKGVHYSLRNIPRQADEIEPSAATPVYFFPPLKTQDTAGWMLIRANYEHEINFLGTWAWHGDARANAAEQAILNAQLPALPDSVRAVSAAGQGVSVYWNEIGGEEVLQQVLGLLESLKQAVINPQ
jgi:hypothetical protein